MKITVIEESGYEPALFGLGLSHGLTSEMEYDGFQDYNNATFDRVQYVANTLHDKDGGHNKFLESIAVWIDIDAPRFWWSEMDTYRVGISKQSESTMHTLGKREITGHDFEYALDYEVFICLSNMIARHEDIEYIKNVLPEGFLQRRIVCTNYRTLRNIINQRKTHRLPQWKQFCAEIINQVQHPELLPEVSA